MGNKEVSLLVFLLRTESKLCPPKDFFPVNEKKLNNIAIKNKATPFLFHFLNCPSCQKNLTPRTIKKLSRDQKFTLIWPLYYQEEKQNLGKFCQKAKIKAGLIKDFSPYPKMELHQKFLLGYDIDILVNKRNLPIIESLLKREGYKLKTHTILKNNQGKIHYEEKNFHHPQKYIAVDLHTQLAIPHNDEFHFLSWKKIGKASVEILQNSKRQKQSQLYLPTMEYFLLSLFIHYLGSDLLKGLRNLLDITQFAHLYDREINWEKFLILTRRFKVTNSSLFILLLGSQVFDLPFPQSLRKATPIPLRVKFLVPYYSAEKIALFPPTEQWSPKNKKARKIFYENFFIKIFLADSVNLRRLIRPRIFLFAFVVGVRWINKFVSRLCRKFP